MTRQDREPPILTEDQVIDAVCEYLEERSWRILVRARATERGGDIVAVKGERRLVIEAKGAGSSKPGTARFGRPFDKGQVFDHVAKAVLKALRVVSTGEAWAGIALPGDVAHVAEVERIRDALAALDIAVFLVKADQSVDFDAAGSL